MQSRFELFVALRYLTARRKQAVISVITLISVLGVAAGVMALVVAMAVTNGFRNTLQQKLLGATAHVMVMEKEVSEGIKNWRELGNKLRYLAHVKRVSPSLYDTVMFSGTQPMGGVLKGILSPEQSPPPDILRHLKAGNFTDWQDSRGYPPIILGSKLAEQIGMTVGEKMYVFTRQGEITPAGPKFTRYPFFVIGIFESGFVDIDGSWAFTSLDAVQKILGLTDVVNAVELDIDNLELAPQVAKAAEAVAGPKLAATHWMEQNKQLFSALSMEKAVTVVVIGLIQIVAALNILITLTMMTMEKQRDIALLISMGAKRAQISRIFILQGLVIGIVGTISGVIAGHAICHFADKYRLLELNEAVYSLSFVPFQPRPTDTLWIAAVALIVSFLATLLPARAATRIAPVEALRYE